MITRRAPGKLFIAGEYAVLEPGHPAVLVAVDRFVTVAVLPANHTTTLTSDSNGGAQIRCAHIDGRLIATGDSRTPQHFAYALAAATMVEQLAIQMGCPSRHFDMKITGGDFTDSAGRKLGLGSSAATTVATVAALGAYYDLGLDRMDRFRLAMLATLAVNPNGSGADVAASAWGGWLAYTAPDRTRLTAHMAEHGIASAFRSTWSGLSVQQLSPPRRARLLVGWTGEPQSTAPMIAQITNGDKQTPLFHKFLADSDACVRHLIDAIAADDVVEVQHRVGQARQLLEGLDAALDIGIRTRRLDALCAAADLAGVAAKPSGAGGGDCGIAIIDRNRPEPAVELTRSWLAAGIEPIALHTYSSN
jgi:phosphomevalonate kinase